MKYLKYLAASLIITITSAVFILIGPKTTSAILTPDEIELCKITCTYMGTGYVDYMDFLYCVNELSKD